MKKFLFIYIIFILCISLYAFPLKIVSEQDELKVYNNLIRIDYSFEGSEDYAYIDKLGLKSDIWFVYFHSFTGNARELYRSHIYKDLWISKIREEKYGSVSMNIFGDSFLFDKAARSSHYFLHYLKEKYKIKKFIAIGASMGGFCALRYAELYPQDVFCVISVAPNIDLAEMLKEKDYFVFADAVKKAREKFFPNEESVAECNLYDKIKNLNMPIYLCISREDEMVPVCHVDEFARVMIFNNKFKYVCYDKGTHLQTFSKGFSDGWDWFMGLKK